MLPVLVNVPLSNLGTGHSGRRLRISKGFIEASESTLVHISCFDLELDIKCFDSEGQGGLMIVKPRMLQNCCH